jgi:hypothetical protein
MNQQLLPQTTYPIAGDVQSTPGNPLVKVTGMQATPISAQPPQDGQIYIYDANTNSLIPGDPIVSGPDATNTNPTRNPVQVSGIDDSNLVRELRTDSYGSLRSQRIEELLEQILEMQKKTVLAIAALDDTADIDI